ncbi:class I SAM-dependent methyltransferase [Chitinophaga horti]|uniref:Class I SAM-dependent methyltransferase n=1 Tax=Chitinophaga horti TaxID=2920382 RepID=A0ABY6J2S2_9BACT|nr:class I SAM-dependent methyltransferase [Chitinophaga horti]UYQ93966.1 class I SAM-dependent methyltransferase [Chitinophaga horti]
MSIQHQIDLAKKYLRYYLSAGNRHDVHSPFVFSLIEEVLNKKAARPEYAPMETLREQLLQSKDIVNVTDLGAGSLTGAGTERKISDITRHAAKPPKFGQLFYRLVQYFKPAYVLELGTSMGMSTAYMAKGRPESTIYTIEGCPNITAKAKANFASLGLTNVRQFTGNFDDVLPQVLAQVTPDFVYIDGNHRKEPTLDYFRQCAAKASEHAVFIFDDIHWTPGMEEAWKTIQDDERVTLTIDLFFIGLVFFRKDFKVKQHFTIKF